MKAGIQKTQDNRGGGDGVGVVSIKVKFNIVSLNHYNKLQYIIIVS